MLLSAAVRNVTCSTGCTECSSGRSLLGRTIELLARTSSLWLFGVDATSGDEVELIGK
jgi:hypothetical protein